MGKTPAAADGREGRLEAAGGKAPYQTTDERPSGPQVLF
jgi:hypothetical protein